MKESDLEKMENELMMDIFAWAKDKNSLRTSNIQRTFKIGYNRALRALEKLEGLGFVSKPRSEIGIYSWLVNPDEVWDESLKA